MEILEIVKTLQAYTEDVVAYKLDSEFAHAVTEAVSLLIEQGERLTDVDGKEGGWIPTSLGFLPDESGYYLAHTAKGNIHALPYSARHKAFNSFDGELEAHFAIHVTHWMPLPEAPKGVE